MLIAFDTTEFIVNIVTYSVEIFAVLVFIETIELNFCKLNVNLKKNIIFRADVELDSIYKVQKGIVDNDSVSNNSESLNDIESNNDDNSVYT